MFVQQNSAFYDQQGQYSSVEAARPLQAMLEKWVSQGKTFLAGGSSHQQSRLDTFFFFFFFCTMRETHVFGRRSGHLDPGLGEEGARPEHKDYVQHGVDRILGHVT